MVTLGGGFRAMCFFSPTGASSAGGPTFFSGADVTTSERRVVVNGDGLEIATMLEEMQVDDGALGEEPAGSTGTLHQTAEKHMMVEASSGVDKENHQVRQRG